MRRKIPSLTIRVYTTTKLPSLRKDRLKTQRMWRMICLTLLSASCFVRGSRDCWRRWWKRPSWCPISAFTSFLCSSHWLLWPIMSSSCWSRASTPCCVLSHWLRTLSTTDRWVKIRQRQVWIQIPKQWDTPDIVYYWKENAPTFLGNGRPYV